MKNKSIKKIVLLLPSLFILTSCNISDFLNISDSIAGNIFPNLWDFLVQFLAFVVMIILVIVFAHKPVKKFIKAREDALNKERDETFKNNEESRVKLEDVKKEIASSRAKANKIIEDAKIEGNKEKEKILLETNEQIKKQFIEANEQIENDKNKAKEELKDELSEVALSLSSKILEREVNKNDNQKIIDDFINK